MKARGTSRLNREIDLLTGLAACASVISFLFYYRHGDVLLYGDAVAHINIARRLFDSRTPGLLQLGTVWLPLPHLLMAPFLLSKQMWVSGWGGSIPSMLAYVAGVVGIFRLVRELLTFNGHLNVADRAAAWGAAIAHGANPNLLYMQSTAMTESLYLAFFIWAVVYFSEFAQGKFNAAIKCGLCLIGASLTRYDGWFLSAAMVAAAIAMTLWSGERRPLRRPLVKMVLLAISAPALWLAYNTASYGNPLEFATGPYSARGIAKSSAVGDPVTYTLWSGTRYFLKSAELNVADAESLERLWLALAILGVVTIAGVDKRSWPALLLAVPLPFYALSMNGGSVPIFTPTWWPFSYYNVRYGLELLPALVVLGAVGVAFLLRLSESALGPIAGSKLRWYTAAIALAAFALVPGSYIGVWRRQPICYREAAINTRSKQILEAEIAGELKPLPADATLLMYLGEHPGAVEDAGIPMRHVINEGNRRVWPHALADPQAFADYVIAFDGDPVWKAIQGRRLTQLAEVQIPRQPRGVIYCTR